MKPATWFHINGVGLFPLKWRSKEPACKWLGYQCTPEEPSRFTNYGVRLGQCRDGWLLVVDTDDGEDEAWAEANLPDTPFKVRTARGWHRYYLSHGPVPKFIRRDGHVIECRNQGQYVVGPGSIHPSGAIYTPSDWSWRWSEITLFPLDFIFDDGSCGRASAPRDDESVGGQPLRLSSTVVANERHATLHKIMRSMVARGVPIDGAVDACRAENLARCRPPLQDSKDLDRFLRRAYRQQDRAGFVRTPRTGWDLAGSLVEIGLSIDAVLVAVRSLDPTFDPETSA